MDCLKNHKSTIGRLSEQFHITQEEVKSYIWMLREDFENITTIKSNKTGELLYYLKVLPNANNVYFINGPDKKERVLRFGFVSDMHFSSIFHMSESFHDVMDKLENLGVSKVYVAGDILDGAGMFKGHEETLRQFDVDGQTKIAAEAFAKHPSLEFWGISGNHDISFIKYNKKVNPLEILEMKSDNFKNLGNTSADVICHGNVPPLSSGTQNPSCRRFWCRNLPQRHRQGGQVPRYVLPITHFPVAEALAHLLGKTSTSSSPSFRSAAPFTSKTLPLRSLGFRLESTQI